MPRTSCALNKLDFEQKNRREKCVLELFLSKLHHFHNQTVEDVWILFKDRVCADSEYYDFEF